MSGRHCRVPHGFPLGKNGTMDGPRVPSTWLSLGSLVIQHEGLPASPDPPTPYSVIISNKAGPDATVHQSDSQQGSTTSTSLSLINADASALSQLKHPPNMRRRGRPRKGDKTTASTLPRKTATSCSRLEGCHE
ncbi:hypothetical protein CAPTEDRAFT_188790 [Capitella teleta]|uniref:Uncharacterized protein n=1 Tax=Capitella teleta TaxID=283909 RepID=R7T6I1_CAPTE|nr:hypothetical protein CAPTEDRAFT_188790 [Capitella teleta]|eukprot:ELT86965.1 hypothetical protein CAPTEDRAFT_188790 [Capitella teleta]